MLIIGAAALVVTVLTLVVTVVGLGKDWKAGVLACAVVLAVLALLLVVAWLATRQRRAAPQDVEPVSRRHGPSPPMEWMEAGHFVTFTDSFYRSGSDDDRPVTAVAEIEAIDNGRVRLLWRSGEGDGMPTEVSLMLFRSTLTGLRCPAAGAVVTGRGWSAHRTSPAGAAATSGTRFRDLEAPEDRARFVDEAHRWADGRQHR